MAKKSAKIDEFVELIHDDRVASAIRTCLSADINVTIEAMFAKLTATFMATIRADLEKFATGLISETTKTLTSKISTLEEENRTLSQRLDTLETSARQKNLIIHGIIVPTIPAWSEKNNYTTLVIDLCQNHLGIQIAPSDINAAYPLPGPGNVDQRPVLVNFLSRRLRDQVYHARKTLRSLSAPTNKQRIFINEHLTRLNAHIFAGTRKLVREKKLHSTWTSGGFVFVRSTNSLDEKPAQWRSLKELDKFT